MSDHSGLSYRDVIVFQCLGDRSGIWRDRLGLDVEIGPPRVITSVLGMERLAMLRPGELYTQHINNPHMSALVRWTHEA